MSYSIVIPSRNSVNLLACVGAIRAAGERGHIIIVDDGLDSRLFDSDAVLMMRPFTLMAGIKPFVFARNINLGIRSCDTSVVLLNDDAILRTPHGFEVLSALCADGWGAMCPGFTPGSVGTPNLTWRGRQRVTEEKQMLVFACVYIPRRTINRVGLLDEAFGLNAAGDGPRGYGCEDDDYSLRIRQAGMKLGVYDGVLVDHLPETTGLQSTFRHDPARRHDVRAHENLFREKHGHWPEGHGYPPR